MKNIGKVFYGRIATLDSILDKEPSAELLDNLDSYFLRNAFLSDKEYIDQSKRLANYTNDINKKISSLDLDNIINLKIDQFDIF